MDENTVVETVSKTRLSRKGLILIGATAGLILAGGYALVKSSSKDDTVEDAPAN